MYVGTPYIAAILINDRWDESCYPFGYSRMIMTLVVSIEALLIKFIVFILLEGLRSIWL